MRITVYLGSSMGNDSIYAEKAAELGSWIGRSGHTLVYGGAKRGLMGILADHVLKEGGKAIGVIPHFIADLGVVHPELTELHYSCTMQERKTEMITLGDAFIAMPGGPGTLEEISEVISLVRLGRMHKPCILYDINGYYEDLRNMFAHMTECGFLREEEMKDVHFVRDLDGIRALLKEEKTSG